MGELHPLARLALDHAASARERPGRCDIQGGGGRRGGRSRCDARRRRRAGRAPPRCAGAHRGLLAPELAQGVPRRPLTLKAWREILGEKNTGETRALGRHWAHRTAAPTGERGSADPFLTSCARYKTRNAVPFEERSGHVLIAAGEACEVCKGGRGALILNIAPGVVAVQCPITRTLTRRAVAVKMQTMSHSWH